MEPKIQIPKEEFSQGPVNINLRDYLPNREKKNLVNLSDEELAQLSSEELEKVKQAKANLLIIKKMDKEVDAMASQEEFQKVVQQVAEEHNLTLDEAEVLVKKKMGMGSGPTSDLAMMAQLFQPKENPLVEEINKAIAKRIAEGQPLFGPAVALGGPGNPPGGGQPNNNITTAVKNAKEAGVQSIYLPDGSQIMLQAGGEGSSTVKNIEQKIMEYVDGVVSTGLPNVFKTPTSNKGTDLPLDLNPALARLFYEDKWKDRDREAEDARSKARDEVITTIAASFGAALSPEGFEKIKKMIKQGGAAGALSEGKREEKSTAKMVRAVCWKCSKPFRYDEGEEAVCPYCGTDYKVQCQRCKTFFTPTNVQEIKCSKCGAEYTWVEEKGEEAKEEEPSPSSGEEPSFRVGSGLVE